MKKSLPAKETLLNGFIILIHDIGAHQVTLQKVAKKAKVPFSTAHYYYGGDWDRIFSDAVQVVGERLQTFTTAYIQSHSNVKSNPIELYVNASFQWILENKYDPSLWLFNFYFSSLKPDFAVRQDEFVEQARKRVLGLLFEAKGKGFYPKLKVTQDAAVLAHTLVHGFAIQAVVQNHDAKKVNAIRKQAIEQINQALENA